MVVTKLSRFFLGSKRVCGEWSTRVKRPALSRHLLVFWE